MRYSKTKNLKIVSIETGEELGEIKKIIIDYNTGKFIGLLLRGKLFVHAEEVDKFGEDAAMVRGSKDVVPLKDNQEVIDIIKDKIKVIGNNVVTQSGDELGEVKDYEVDEVENKLAKIFVSTGIFKDLFKGKLIITADKIISIGKDAIVVKDSSVPQKDSVKTKEEVEKLAEAGVLHKDLE